ncbi:MAG TPA: hypothetical protein VMZ69_06635, partial [Saprospiraceae bacterium]|nr:hypothetical protein [Saprospiraceae bacterium]
DINTHTERDAISIPIQAVTTREPEKEKNREEKEEVKKPLVDEEIDEVVFVMDADTAKMVSVETGIQDNEYIQILSGLIPDQEVITGPYSTVSRKLKSGMDVERKKKDEEKEKDKKEED